MNLTTFLFFTMLTIKATYGLGRLKTGYLSSTEIHLKDLRNENRKTSSH